MLARKYLTTSIIVVLLAASSCSSDGKAMKKGNKEQKMDAGKIEKGAEIQSASANLNSVNSSEVTGKVTFNKVPGGIEIVADIEGLAPGKHGFHIHEHGSCGGEGASEAGGHFNPTNHSHAGPDSADRHVGDLGNLEADDNGYAHYERIDKIIALEGPNSIIGRSVIVHVDEDDFTTQPTGNAGARAACGIIEAVNL